MKIQLENPIYRLQGIAGALYALSLWPEITEASTELQEMVNLLADDVRGVYQELRNLRTLHKELD